MNHQNKQLVWSYWRAMDDGDDHATITNYLHQGVFWHGFRPLRYLHGLHAIWTQFWHPHMVWHGPVGIGSAYSLAVFKKNVQGPIVSAFPDRKGVGHQARIAEGVFAASTGWPSLGGTHVNRYMDWPSTGEHIGWNIMDFWKRDGDKLLENWVMIDLIDAAFASNIDLLARVRIR